MIENRTCIQANELRIGNWVIINDRLIDPNAVKSPYYYVVVGFDLYKIDENDANENGVQPIPITPEIMAKAGFRHDVEDDTSYYKKNGLWFCHAGDDWYLSTHTEFKAFHYLHQLQNLFFDLTGAELEINLP